MGNCTLGRIGGVASPAPERLTERRLHAARGDLRQLLDEVADVADHRGLQRIIGRLRLERLTANVGIVMVGAGQAAGVGGARGFPVACQQIEAEDGFVDFLDPSHETACAPARARPVPEITGTSICLSGKNMSPPLGPSNK
jgi:hypothetical protein